MKDIFRCPRCGVSGGVLDLHSLYTGIPREAAKAELTDKLGQGTVSLSPSAASQPQECPLTDLSTRHETYSALLQLLSLAPDHRDNLLRRGVLDAPAGTCRTVRHTHRGPHESRRDSPIISEMLFLYASNVIMILFM